MTHHNKDHHHHHESHHHHEEVSPDLSEKEKLIKLLDHWVKHNGDHADNYLQWAHKAKENGFQEVAQCLEEAAKLTHSITEKFIQANQSLQK
jgi:rubrerythrin